MPTGGVTAADRRRTWPSRRSPPSAAPGWSRPTCWPPGSWDEVAARCAATVAAVGPSAPDPTYKERPDDRDPSRRRVPLRRRVAGRGDAAARPGRGPDPHRAPLPRPGRAAASTTSPAACAACFGLRAGVVTALADNEVGRLRRGPHPAPAASTPRSIRWVPYDGIGRTVRNGLNFTERGFGVRGAVGVSDRGHTAAAQLTPGRRRLGRTCSASSGVRWLHTGGIFAALSRARPPRRHRGGDGGGPAARHGRLLRPQLPAQPVEGDRRPGAGAGGQPRARAATST